MHSTVLFELSALTFPLHWSDAQSANFVVVPGETPDATGVNTASANFFMHWMTRGGEPGWGFKKPAKTAWLAW